MDIMEVVTTMGEGNPGGLTVVVKLMETDKELGFLDVLSLDDMNIRGSQIWVGFKDFAGEDIEVFRQAIRDRNPDMISKINDEMFGFTEKAVGYGASSR